MVYIVMTGIEYILGPTLVPKLHSSNLWLEKVEGKG